MYNSNDSNESLHETPSSTARAPNERLNVRLYKCFRASLHEATLNLTQAKKVNSLSDFDRRFLLELRNSKNKLT